MISKKKIYSVLGELNDQQLLAFLILSSGKPLKKIRQVNLSDRFVFADEPVEMTVHSFIRKMEAEPAPILPVDVISVLGKIKFNIPQHPQAASLVAAAMALRKRVLLQFNRAFLADPTRLTLFLRHGYVYARSWDGREEELSVPYDVFKPTVRALVTCGARFVDDVDIKLH